jgi:hypothetical protein
LLAGKSAEVIAAILAERANADVMIPEKRGHWLMPLLFLSFCLPSAS